MSDRNHLNQVIDLIQKNGERCIVIDDEESPYVVMTLGEYERLVSHERQNQSQKIHTGGLTSQELLDKINQDIALWKSEENKNIIGDGLNFPQFVHLENIEKKEDNSFKEMGLLTDKEQYFTESLD